MAMVFTHFTWWYRGGKNQSLNNPHGISLNSVADSGLLELDNVKFPLVNRKADSSSRRAKRKWHSREQRKIDKEYDVVLVPSDGGCVSGSESDDSDYSVGWLEPHDPGFLSDNDSDDSFAVIVPCYGRCQGDLEDRSKDKFLDGLGRIPGIYDADSKRYMDEWLSYLQGS